MSDNGIPAATTRRGHRPDLLVGAGVVNLLTALALVDDGRPVLLLDAAPDPRAGHAWQEYGCTRGGANARMFTATEADQYSGLVPVGRSAGSVFDTSPEHGGWDVRRSDVHDVHDHGWIREHTGVPTWLADRYRTGIHGLNQLAEQGWERVFEAHPQLAASTHLRRDILRLYSTSEALGRAVDRHRTVGDLLAVHPRDEIAERAPALAHASADRISGGVSVRGFTLDVHRFVAVALDILEANGAQLRFGTEVSGVRSGPDGVVDAVVAGSEVLPVDNVIISPGAYGSRLLAGLGLQGRIAGVLGLWHVLPDLWGQEHSMKVSRPGRIAQDANITVGTAAGGPVLVVGAGYGFTGTGDLNIDHDRLRVIARSVDEMMRDLLPDAHEAAGGPAWMDDPRFCVRPWTPTSLGLFDVRATRRGRCVVTGGHNTGGFAQAPEVARAVLAALHGRGHPMHDVYHDAQELRPVSSSSGA
jgi:glycine/D-amino acid oxidase-like deaminating enzyme